MASRQNAAKLDIFSANEIDAKLALLLVEKPSSTDLELAEKLGVCRQTVNKHRNSAPVQSLVRSTLAIPEREVRRLTAKALSRLEAMLDHEDPRIRLAATLALVKLSPDLMSDKMRESFLNF